MDPETQRGHPVPPRDRTEGPPEASPKSSPSHARNNVPRHYPIRADTSYSLRDAAELLGLPEGTLRRAILLESLQAEELGDDRQYLLDGKSLLAFVRKLRPEEEIHEERDEGGWWGLVILLLLPLVGAILILVAGSTRSPSSEGPPVPSPRAASQMRLSDY
jgi:hypothetical protein